MATKSKKIEVKKIEATAEVSAEIARGYSALVNHDGEIQFVLDVAQLMADGKASVRGVQDAIATCSGTAPTIRKSHAQWFPIFADIVSNVSDAEAQSVSELLKMAERVGRNHGAEKALSVIESAKDFADLGAKSPTQSKARKNAKAEKSISTMSIEEVIAGSLQAIRKVGGKNIAEAKTADLDNLRALLAVLVKIAKNSESKVSA